MPFRVVVVERDSMTADLLAGALTRESGCDARAVSSADLLSELSAVHADLVVISADLHANGVTGFQLAQALTHAHPQILMVMILSRSTPNEVIQAFRSGARGIVSRDQSISLVLRCVEHVRRGYIWVGGREADFLLTGVRSIPATDLAVAGAATPLTEREMQVVRHAAMGKTNKSIAGELRLSEHTVKNYLFRAFEKLGVSSRVELLFYLTMQGHQFGPGKAVDLSVGKRERRAG